MDRAQLMALVLQAEYALKSPELGADAALPILKKALGLAPQDPGVWLVMARARGQLDDHAAAAVAAGRAVELDPDDVGARYLLGEQLMRAGDVEGAEPHLRFAVEHGISGRNQYLPYYYLHVCLRQQGDVDGAVAVLDAWARDLPGDRHPPAYKARLFWDFARDDSAAEAALEALDRDPANEEALRILLRSWELDPPRAAAGIEDVLRRNWSAVVLHRTLVTLYEDIGRYDRALEHLRSARTLDPSARGNDDLNRARLLLASNRVDDALGVLGVRPATAGDDGSSQASLLAARAHAARRDWDEAIALCRSVRLPVERRVEATLLAAELQVRRAPPGPEREGAVRAALEGLAALDQELSADLVDSRADLAAGAIRLAADHAPALGAAWIERLHRLDGERGRWLQLEYDAARGDFEEALRAATQLQGERPSSLALVGRRVEFLQRLGRGHEALDLIQEAFEAVDEREQARLERATGAAAVAARHDATRNRVFLFLRRSFLQRAQGELEAAETALRSVLELQSGNADALNALGYLFAEHDLTERLEEGRALVDQALEQRPWSGAYRDSLGWLLFRQGRLDEAVEQLLQADALAPDEAEILEHLGDAWRALGRFEKARDAYRRAQDLHRPGPEREQLVRKLEVLESSVGGR